MGSQAGGARVRLRHLMSIQCLLHFYAKMVSVLSGIHVKAASKEKPGAACFLAHDMNEQAGATRVRNDAHSFSLFKDSERESYDPKAFVESCKALKMEFGPYQQNDSTEFKRS